MLSFCQKFFKPIPQIGQILKDFGFVADEAGRVPFLGE